MGAGVPERVNALCVLPDGDLLVGSDYPILVPPSAIMPRWSTRRICVADMNCSGLLEVQDIFDYLAAWFDGAAVADLNGDGLSVQDIFAFLNLWFAGC